MQKYEAIKQPKLAASIFMDGVNKRVRVDDIRGNLSSLLTRLKNEVESAQCEKLIIKAREYQFKTLLELGFVHEGVVNRYFNGDSVHFMSKFIKDERRTSKYWSEEDDILAAVQELRKHPHKKDIEQSILLAETSDAEKLAHLYKEVFQLYPVPLHDPRYIREAMNKGTIFVCIKENGQVISAASAEIDFQYKNAEITDCATLPQYRKGGFMKNLISKLEDELLSQGIFCSYTIARALSYGMNAVFHQLGYQYRGRLANNCYIYDKLEDMNIWEKDLGQ
ncbi:putative beta-lysine N-acetyltransferase [Bacillus sp. Marseille-Q1617]|uniref:putative beta-lysine N-acetyltransferase n=1 Tax=Bacillus sp. Marseille-Q1617 TaxID=2736887 RepID=UPI00158850B6|nr:putative beta-lysine N-acetyltransferase [Bacillus sp. Marseille-Q1617]